MVTMAAILKICFEPSLEPKCQLTRNLSGNHVSNTGPYWPFCLIYPKYLDRHAKANSLDPDQMLQNGVSDQGPHCLPLIQQCFKQS